MLQRCLMHIFLLQHNPTPGDFKGNARQLADMALKASAQLAEGEHALCLVPAYALAGVPWESLKHVGGFYSRCREAAQELAEELKDGPDLLLSLTGAEIPLYALLSKGRIQSVARQPNGIIRIPGGPTLYLPETDPAWAHLEAQDLLTTARTIASVDAVLFTASEYFVPGAQEKREMNCAAMAQLWNMPVIYVQQCGAVDSFIYSGQSFVIDASGRLLCRAAAFQEDMLALTLEKRLMAVCPRACGSGLDAIQPSPQGPEALYRAIVLGIRDYTRKCGIPGVVIGLSGGMDSALVASLAVDALGAENVLGVLMPSQWSSAHSISDAKALAANLGITTKTAVIAPMMAAFDAVLAPLFSDLSARPDDLTAENLQPRIRGTLLMAFANRMGRAVLGTGNKSENAVGYCTLYGDTVGALEPIGDIYKTEVYELARWYNEMHGTEVIPESVFTKAPSAELHADQVDEDSLPPYPILDAILRQLLENIVNPETLVVPGVDKSVVRDVVRRVAGAEFKRHQCAPTLKLSSSTLGIDWNMPAVAKIL